MRLLWWRKGNENLEHAESLAVQSKSELQKVRGQWPTVNRISKEIDAQIEQNHFGDLLTYSFQKRTQEGS